MRKRQSRSCYQPALIFPRETLWGQLPSEARHRCRGLFVQLLRDVLQARKEQGREDEREDQAVAP